MNEPWYRSAVLQHHIESDSFVFSVPYDAGNLNLTLICIKLETFFVDLGELWVGHNYFKNLLKFIIFTHSGHIRTSHIDET